MFQSIVFSSDLGGQPWCVYALRCLVLASDTRYGVSRGGDQSVFEACSLPVCGSLGNARCSGHISSDPRCFWLWCLWLRSCSCLLGWPFPGFVARTNSPDGHRITPYCCTTKTRYVLTSDPKTTRSQQPSGVAFHVMAHVGRFAVLQKSMFRVSLHSV